jgi:predicted nucleotidyltransferase
MVASLAPALIEHHDAIAALCRSHGVRSLEVYGSAADGRFDPGRSDYDLIVTFAPRAGASLGRRYVALAEALEALLGARVDLMTDHPVDNPYLHAAIAATRRPLYAEPAAQAPA